MTWSLFSHHVFNGLFEFCSSFPKYLWFVLKQTSAKSSLNGDFLFPFFFCKEWSYTSSHSSTLWSRRYCWIVAKTWSWHRCKSQGKSVLFIRCGLQWKHQNPTVCKKYSRKDVVKKKTFYSPSSVKNEKFKKISASMVIKCWKAEKNHVEEK